MSSHIIVRQAYCTLFVSYIYFLRCPRDPNGAHHIFRVSTVIDCPKEALHLHLCRTCELLHTLFSRISSYQNHSPETEYDRSALHPPHIIVFSPQLPRGPLHTPHHLQLKSIFITTLRDPQSFISVKNAATTAIVDEPSAEHCNADAAPQLTAASHVPLWPACGQQEHEWCELCFEQRLRTASSFATSAAAIVSAQCLRPRPAANVSSRAGRARAAAPRRRPHCDTSIEPAEQPPRLTHAG